jgi:hypothetical protein
VATEDKDAAPPKCEEALDKSSSAAAEKMYIPDYVMLDFGFPKEREPAGGHLSQ